jgi:large subunit ribosomal protein L21
MKYAVIKTGGKQYRVSEGDVIEIDRLASDSKKVLFDQVLLLVNDDAVKIGKPFVTGEKVEASLIENIKGEKIRVSKYKSKVRYRRTTGFRAFLSKVQIDKVGTTATKTTSSVKKN